MPRTKPTKPGGATPAVEPDRTAPAPEPPRRGQPPKPPELRKRQVLVMLTPAQQEQARQIGEGNVSRGIQLAIYQAAKRAPKK